MKVKGAVRVTQSVGGAVKGPDAGGLIYPYFEVYEGNSQAIAQSTWTNIDYDTAVANTDTSIFSHSTSTNPEQITILKTGMYFLSVNNGFASNTTGTRLLRFLINGTGNTERKREEYWDASSQTDRQGFAIMWKLTAGDIIRIQCWQDATSSLALQSAQSITNFRMIYIGLAGA
jgi:hypothetical protein